MRKTHKERRIKKRREEGSDAPVGITHASKSRHHKRTEGIQQQSDGTRRKTRRKTTRKRKEGKAKGRR